MQSPVANFEHEKTNSSENRINQLVADINQKKQPPTLHIPNVRFPTLSSKKAFYVDIKKGKC